MYLTSGSPIDPVSVFEFYVKKLNKKNDWLWQKPKRQIRGEEDEWYGNVPIGKHPLEGFMKQLSKDAGLSTSYTNHCIRATVITNLDNAGFEARHIKAISGHKSDETIESYAVHCPDAKKREMSDALSEKMKPKKKKLVATPTSTVTKNPEPDEPTMINFNDIVDFVPIENNADDFDIGNIIQEVQEIESHPENPINMLQQSKTAVTPVPNLQPPPLSQTTSIHSQCQLRLILGHTTTQIILLSLKCTSQTAMLSSVII